MATPLEDRVSRLEGAYEHLAIKADLADLKVDLIKWMIGLMLGTAALATSIALLVLKLTG
jgi:hypothetical protein